jgi:hypothetical protein
MTEPSDRPETFASSLADILFRDRPAGVGPLVEDDLVARFEKWFVQADLTQLYVMAGYVDRTLVANLPGAHQLAIARVVEERHPRLIFRMPTLLARQDHLRRSHELAEVFMPESLSRLAAAIAKEVS